MSEVENQSRLANPQRLWDAISRANASSTKLPPQEGTPQLIADRVQIFGSMTKVAETIGNLAKIRVKESPKGQAQIDLAMSKLKLFFQEQTTKLAEIGKKLETRVAGLTDSFDLTKKLNASNRLVLNDPTAPVEDKLAVAVGTGLITAKSAQRIGRLFEGTLLSESYSYTA